MPETRTDRILRFSKMHYDARVKAGKSQEYMALELGISKKTVQNWEKGLSSPSFFQSLEWFRVLNVNPYPYYLTYVYPDKLTDLKPSDSDEKINAAFSSLIENIHTDEKRALLYLYYGDHGSSPHSLLQLVLAHLHTPIESRIATAFLVSHVYELNKRINNIICPDNILPDTDDLKAAIAKAEIAVLNHGYGYTNVEKEDA